MTGALTPVEFWNLSCVRVGVYLDESAKNASSAVTRLRRSDFIAVMYAFDLVFANFGIAIAAKMPMITTTINNSISVKPLRSLSIALVPGLERLVRGVKLRGLHFSNGRTVRLR